MKRTAGVALVACLAIGGCTQAQAPGDVNASITADLAKVGVTPANGIEQWKAKMRENVCDAKEEVVKLTVAMLKDKGETATLSGMKVAAQYLCPDRAALLN